MADVTVRGPATVAGAARAEGRTAAEVTAAVLQAIARALQRAVAAFDPPQSRLQYLRRGFDR